MSRVSEETRTVKDIIIELLQYPMGSKVYAYEGEMTGLVVVAKDGQQSEILTTSL